MTKVTGAWNDSQGHQVIVCAESYAKNNPHARFDTPAIIAAEKQMFMPGSTCNYNERKDNKQCLLDAPGRVTVNKENYYREYKGHTKWLSLISSHFAKDIFFGMTLLHAHAHYICLVYMCKYQKASSKAPLQVDFLMYALSKQKHNPYLIGNRKKQSYHFVKK